VDLRGLKLHKIEIKSSSCHIDFIVDSLEIESGLRVFIEENLAISKPDHLLRIILINISGCLMEHSIHSRVIKYRLFLSLSQFLTHIILRNRLTIIIVEELLTFHKDFFFNLNELLIILVFLLEFLVILNVGLIKGAIKISDVI
jgi:hypothetical protein